LNLRGPLVAVVLLLLAAGNAAAQYPEIGQLSPRDPLFKQLQEALQRYFRATSRPTDPEAPRPELPPLKIYAVRVPTAMDLFGLAARLNLPYDTIATLNNLEGPGALQPGMRLLVPSLPGLYVSLQPGSTFEEIVLSVTSNRRSEGREIQVFRDGGARHVLFFVGESLTAVERAYFLNILFRLPLPSASLSSGYGTRPNPFDGHAEFHQGVDLVAPPGTEVYAARDGVVVRVEFDPVLGNVVVLRHDAGYETVYGHLSVIEVRLNDEVRSGMILGRVGNTGYSTGPHLHFEIRRRGSSRDPVPLLPPLRERVP
jgi:murein DD-endopeptidase MepM/ murein hydrolase activator NlpD